MRFMGLFVLLLAAPQEADRLVEQLGSESFVEREAASEALLKLGVRAVPALEMAVGSKDLEIAARARHLLREIRIGERLTPALRTFQPDLLPRLLKGDDHTWTEAFLSLAEAMESDDAPVPLADLDLDGLAGPALRGARDVDEKKSICLILCGRELPGAAEELRRLLSDPHAGVVSEVLSTINFMQDRPAIPRIRELLQSPVGTVRARAAAALGGMGVRDAAGDLLRMLEDQNAKARGSAALALGLLGNRDAIPVLRRLLRDPHSDVRGAAAEALGILGDTDSSRELRRMLTLTDQWIVWHAASALGFLGDRQAVPQLLDHLAHASPNVRIASTRALTAIGDPGHVKQLVPLLKDSFLRSEAAYALCAMESDRGLAPLLDERYFLDALNALRRPNDWRRLRTSHLEDDFLGTRRDLIGSIAKLIGRTLEIEEAGVAFSGARWIGARNRRTTLYHALSELTPNTHTWIVEKDRLRILPYATAHAFWTRWEKTRSGD